MSKWYLKNKDGIWQTAIGGILGLVIYYNIFPWLSTIIPKLPTNQLLNKLVEVFRYKLTISVGSLLLSVITSIIFISYARKTYYYYLRRNNKLKILKATYYTSEKSLDITQELNNHIIDDKLRILLTNDIAGDPHVRVHKKGKIKYKFKGEDDEKDYEEGDLIELP